MSGLWLRAAGAGGHARGACVTLLAGRSTSPLDGSEPIMFAARYRIFAPWYRMFAAWYRRAITRRRIINALRNPAGGVVILGDDAFVQANTEALELLKNKTPDVHALLLKHIGCVVSSKPARVSRRSSAAGCATTLLAHFPTTMVLMRPYVSELPIEERAGILAHETYHAELYRLAQNGSPHQAPPENAYSGERAETLCVAYECDVLRRLGLDEWDVQRRVRMLESKWWETPGDGWLLP